MNRALILLTVCAATAAAESNFSAPLVGVARDHQKHLRLVYGLAGNFIVKGAVATGVSNAVFSGYGGLAKTDSQLLVLDASGAVIRAAAAPGGSALLAPPSQHSAALSYFVETAELRQAFTHADRRVPLDLDSIAGRVVALASVDRFHAEMAVCRETALWLLAVDLKNGSVAHERMVGGMVGETACRAGGLLLFGNKLVLATAREIVVQSAGSVVQSAGSDERHIAVPRKMPGELTVRQMGENWIQVETPDDAPLLVRMTNGDEKTYRMPVVEVR
jgi:hypothetical protein